jgi:hypothetical protein
MDNQRIMRMLLERVKVSFSSLEVVFQLTCQMTEDDKIHRQLIRMHGLSLMYMILTELSEHRELVLLVSLLKITIEMSADVVGTPRNDQMETPIP